MYYFEQDEKSADLRDALQHALPSEPGLRFAVRMNRICALKMKDGAAG